MASKKFKEVIDFLQNPCDNGWDKNELLTDYVGEILTKAKSELIYADELSISDGEKDVMVLSDFVDSLFDKIIEGVCNVIETAQLKLNPHFIIRKKVIIFFIMD